MHCSISKRAMGGLKLSNDMFATCSRILIQDDHLKQNPGFQSLQLGQDQVIVLNVPLQQNFF